MDATTLKNPVLISVQDLDADSLKMKTLIRIAEVKENRITSALDDLRETHYHIATEMCPFQLGQSVQTSVIGSEKMTLLIAGIMFIPRPPYYRLFVRKKTEYGYAGLKYFDDISALAGVQNSRGTSPDFISQVEQQYAASIIVTRPPWMDKTHPLVLTTPSCVLNPAPKLRKQIFRLDVVKETFPISSALKERKKTLRDITGFNIGKAQHRAGIQRLAALKKLKQPKPYRAPITVDRLLDNKLNKARISDKRLIHLAKDSVLMVNRKKRQKLVWPPVPSETKKEVKTQ